MLVYLLSLFIGLALLRVEEGLQVCEGGGPEWRGLGLSGTQGFCSEASCGGQLRAADLAGEIIALSSLIVLLFKFAESITLNLRELKPSVC